MKILKLKADRFRNLPDKEWDFLEGFQIILGPNEAGKSSLQKAIEFALYGDATSSKSEYLQWKRWGEMEAPKVEIEVLGNGDRYKISRDLESRKNLLILPDGKKSSQKEKIRELVAMLTGLPTIESFVATVCLRQEEFAIDPERGEIQSLLEKNALSGSGVDIDQLISKLERKIKEYKVGLEKLATSPGPIKRKQDEINRTRTELHQYQNLLAEMEDAEEKLEHLRKKLKENHEELGIKKEYLKRHKAYKEALKESKRMEDQYQDLVNKKERLTKIEKDLPQIGQELKEIQNKIQEINQKISKAKEFEATKNSIDKLKKEIEAIDQDIIEIERLEKELHTLRKDQENIPLSLEDLSNLKSLPDEIAKLEKTLLKLMEQRQKNIEERTNIEKNIEVYTVDLERREKEFAEAQGERKKAKEYYELLRTKTDLEQEEKGINVKLAEINQVEAKIEEVKAAVSLTEYLSGIKENDLSAIITKIKQLQVLLGKEGMECIVTPEKPFNLTIEADQNRLYEGIIENPFKGKAARELYIKIGNTATIQVRNISGASRELNIQEQQLNELLAIGEYKTPDELSQALKKRQDIIKELEHLKKEYAIISKKESKDKLMTSQENIQEKLTECLRRMKQLSFAEKPLEVIEGEEERANKHLMEIKSKLEAEKAKYEQNKSQIINEEIIIDTKQELERKRKVHLELQNRGKIENGDDIERLKTKIAKIEHDIKEKERALAKALAGRKKEHICSLKDSLSEKINENMQKLVELTEYEITRDQLDTLARELASKQEAEKVFDSKLRDSKAEKEGYYREKTEEKLNKVAADVRLAKSTMADKEAFYLDPEKEIAIEKRIEELEKSIPEWTADELILQDKANQRRDLKEKIALLEETLSELGTQLSSLNFNCKTNERIYGYLTKARSEILDTLSGHLPTEISKILTTITDRRHAEVRGQNLAFSVWSELKGDVLQDAELSRGTRDQFYLAIRLAFIKALFSKERPPLILDDPLVHCHKDRRENLLALFEEFAKDNQLILFSCHDFEEYRKYPCVKI